MRTHFSSLTAATVVAMMAAAAAQPRVIENRGQALPKGARIASQANRRERMAKTRAAAQELVGISNQTVVVAHLHPRWLRRAVEGLMDKGAEIDMAWVERLKADGPEAAKLAVEVYG